jgi:tetratricopeptide (TPR) repeat protein
MKVKNQDYITRIVAVLFFVSATIACNSQSSAGGGASNEDLLKKIDSLEQFINKEDFTFDNDTAARELVTALVAYVDQNKDDEKSPSYLFKAAGLEKNLRNHMAAVSYFNRIWTEYPDYPRAPDALFLEALMYEEDIQDKEKAKERYNKFLELYPKNEFAEGAKQILLLIDKSPAERYEYLSEQDRNRN